MSNASNKPKGGVVFYPRSYYIDDTSDSSYAIGMNHFNELCVIYIRATDSAKEAARNPNSAQTIPTIAEFSETDRRARNPCYISSDNSMENPCGIILLEQAYKDVELPSSHDGLPVYVGRWASVLRENHDMPMPLLGNGYMEISFGHKDAPEIEDLMFEYKKIISDITNGEYENLLDAEVAKKSLYKRIMSERKKFFTGVIIKSKEIRLIENPSLEVVRSKMILMLQHYTRDGMYGGVMLRVRNDMEVKKDGCFVCNAIFDYQGGVVKDIAATVDQFLKFNFGKIMNLCKGGLLELIPTQRVNCGSRGVDKYSRQFNSDGIPKILKTFVDKDFYDNPVVNYVSEKAFLFCNLAIKVSSVRNGRSGAGNYLLTTAHAFSAPKGNIYSINNVGASAYQVK